jgi:hypothetical protein
MSPRRVRAVRDFVNFCCDFVNFFAFLSIFSRFR